MQKHLIWDFDGTLYDTYPLMTAALQQALADYHATVDYDEALALMKKTLFLAVETYAARFGIPGDALLAAYHRHHAQQKNFPAMPGLAQCLARTSLLGCKHYLFTHRDEVALQQLASDGLLGFFTSTVTRGDGFAYKPSPEAILHLMSQYGFPAREACMIGDRDIDISSGRAAGIGTILLDPDGFYNEIQADIRVRSLSEIAQLVEAQARGL